MFISVYSFSVISQDTQDRIFESSFELVPFGTAGNHAIATPYQEPTQLATIYYPTDANAANKVPVIFFAPGWNSVLATDYDTIFRFIASHGYAVVYAKDENKFTSVDMIEDFVTMVTDKAAILDTTRIGVMGHSIGGGHVFNILDKLSDVHGFGTNARFAFSIEPWFAFDMQQADMQSLPSNTNFIIQQYGIGGYNQANSTDMRIPLTEYYLLESIANNKKDYQVHENADHTYPYGMGTDYSTKQIILAPLDAIMQYTFVDSNDIIAHDLALELGNDDPYADGYGIQEVFPRGDSRIQYLCNGFDFSTYNIDFCDIKGYPNASQFDYIATNNATAKPTLAGSPTIDVEFGTTITRFTHRILQNDTPTQNANGDRYPRGNHHPYPKTQAWNADMTMIRLNYRIYDAETLLEIPLTTPSGNYPLTTETGSLSDLYYINGALNERKWSTIDPNVFYGVYLSGSNGQFWKGTIDRSNQLITYPATPIHHFAGDYEKFSLGKYEGNISYDDNFVVFAARKTNQNYLTAIVYDMANDNIMAQKDFDGTNGNAFVEWTDSPAAQVFDWISVSPLANFILLSTGGNLELYDINLNYIGQLSNEATHGDLGIAQNGEEVFVSFKFSLPQGIMAHRLQKFVDEINDPAPDIIANYHHRLLPEKYNGGHISCRNYQRPGWCYLSTVAEGHREVAALRINFADSSLNVVNRFVQTHTYTQADGSSMGSLGSVSPDGRRVLFFTDWEVNPLNYYDRDTYHVQMPD